MAATDDTGSTRSTKEDHFFDLVKARAGPENVFKRLPAPTVDNGDFFRVYWNICNKDTSTWSTGPRPSVDELPNLQGIKAGVVIFETKGGCPQFVLGLGADYNLEPDFFIQHFGDSNEPMLDGETIFHAYDLLQGGASWWHLDLTLIERIGEGPESNTRISCIQLEEGLYLVLAKGELESPIWQSWTPSNDLLEDPYVLIRSQMEHNYMDEFFATRIPLWSAPLDTFVLAKETFRREPYFDLLPIQNAVLYDQAAKDAAAKASGADDRLKGPCERETVINILRDMFVMAAWKLRLDKIGKLAGRLASDAVQKPDINVLKSLNKVRTYAMHARDMLKSRSDAVEPIEKVSWFRKHNMEALWDEAFSNGAYHALTQQATTMLRDVNETVQLLTSCISVMDADANKRQMERTMVLTFLATFFLPLSLVTGIFGMNIRQIGGDSQNPEWFWPLAILIIILVPLSGVITFYLFRRGIADLVGWNRVKSGTVGRWNNMRYRRREKHQDESGTRGEWRAWWRRAKDSDQNLESGETADAIELPSRRGSATSIENLDHASTRQ